MLVDATRIEEAYAAIPGTFKSSPHFVSDALSELAGTTVLIKDESRNPIGSFKGRGASWWMTCHSEVETIVCASAGNFGQGIAYAARRAGANVHVFASKNASRVKLRAMRNLGADVHLAGHDFDAAKAQAREHATQTGATFVEDGREREVAEGAGTIGIELSRYKRGIDVVYVPIGNGALAAGVGAYLRRARPAVRVVGVCAKDAPAMALSWKQRKLVTTERAETVADGIAVRQPVPAALEMLRDAVDEVILVSEAAIKGAMQLLFAKEGMVSEAAGAVSLAGALSQASHWEGKTIATLMCGKNLDPELRQRWLGTQ